MGGRDPPLPEVGTWRQAKKLTKSNLIPLVLRVGTCVFCWRGPKSDSVLKGDWLLLHGCKLGLVYNACAVHTRQTGSSAIRGVSAERVRPRQEMSHEYRPTERTDGVY
jgi:hypothetical protein